LSYDIGWERTKSPGKIAFRPCIKVEVGGRAMIDPAFKDGIEV
jgi:hypothetical protein